MQILATIIGIFVCLFAGFIPIPQIIHFVRNWETSGISLKTIFFSSLNFVSFFFSVLLRNIQRIKERDINVILALAQTNISFFMVIITLILYGIINHKKEVVDVLIVSTIIVIYLMFCSFFSVYLFVRMPFDTETNTISTFFGVISVILTYIQWLPQIYSSYKQGTKGLSKISICLSIFGAILCGLYLQFLVDQHWIIVSSYYCSAFQQIIILILSIADYFRTYQQL